MERQWASCLSCVTILRCWMHHLASVSRMKSHCFVTVVKCPDEEQHRMARACLIILACSPLLREVQAGTRAAGPITSPVKSRENLRVHAACLPAFQPVSSTFSLSSVNLAVSAALNSHCSLSLPHNAIRSTCREEATDTGCSEPFLCSPSAGRSKFER